LLTHKAPPLTTAFACPLETARARLSCITHLRTCTHAHAGSYSTFVISKAGELVAWGLNNSCQLGIEKGHEDNNLLWEPARVCVCGGGVYPAQAPDAQTPSCTRAMGCGQQGQTSAEPAAEGLSSPPLVSWCLCIRASASCTPAGLQPSTRAWRTDALMLRCLDAQAPWDVGSQGRQVQHQLLRVSALHPRSHGACAPGRLCVKAPVRQAQVLGCPAHQMPGCSSATQHSRQTHRSPDAQMPQCTGAMGCWQP